MYLPVFLKIRDRRLVPIIINKDNILYREYLKEEIYRIDMERLYKDQISEYESGKKIINQNVTEAKVETIIDDKSILKEVTKSETLFVIKSKIDSKIESSLDFKSIAKDFENHIRFDNKFIPDLAYLKECKLSNTFIIINNVNVISVTRLCYIMYRSRDILEELHKMKKLKKIELERKVLDELFEYKTNDLYLKIYYLNKKMGFIVCNMSNVDMKEKNLAVNKLLTELKYYYQIEKEYVLPTIKLMKELDEELSKIEEE